MQTLTIIRPDDMHLHLRDGDALKAVAPYTARQMGRAVIMPNLKPPVVSIADAQAYKERIMAALPEGSAFQPLMTLYLTDNATPELVREAKAAGIVAFKLYPAGATTNSDSGVTDLFKLIPVLEEMAKQGIFVLGSRRSNRPRNRYFRPRGRLYRARDEAGSGASAQPQGRV